MSEPLPEPALAFLSALVKLPAAVKPYRLTQPQFTLLAALYDGPLAVQVLAAKLYGRTNRPITELIHQVQGKGLVTKVQSQADTRVFRVTLTDLGRSTVEKIIRVITTT
jgi:DNA-binding MarR family transcriptional regulator